MKTYWNGERAKARKVTVTVADDPGFPMYWARPLVGQRRDAVEVTYNGRKFYIDDEREPEPTAEALALRTSYGIDPEFRREEGHGWKKVTSELDGSKLPSANLAVVADSIEAR